jgi:biopolymer transport protein ExbD
MRLHKKEGMPSAEADMTPMIDMTFQLIAFFMVLINFSDAETNERIKLPASQLAKPPDAPLETPITLQVTKEGTVLYSAQELAVSALKAPLLLEKNLLERQKKSATDATIIIRADGETKTGVVQEVIKVSQEAGFEKFVMRAMQKEDQQP